MLKKSILSLLVTSIFISGCGSSDDDSPTPEELPNKAPILTANFSPLTEKSASTLSVVATDSDGTVASYLWEQTAGPILTFTGGNTTEISFTAPSVSQDAPVSFKVTVTDNENAMVSTSAETNIERIEANYDLVGTVVGEQYANANVVVTVANDTANVVADENGSFSMTLAVDDDVPLNSSLKLTASTESTLELVSLLPSLEKLSGLIALPQSNAKIQRVSLQAIEDTPAISLSSVSTALYSLLVAANGGTEPSNIDTFELVESQIDPDALIEIAAVVQILINSEADLLPEDTTDIVSLLTDPELYNELVETIEQETPGAIEQAIVDIVDDPALTPPIETADVPALYYQTSPVAPTFIARGGSRYNFQENSTGMRSTSYGVSDFEWSINDGDILLTFSADGGSISYNDVDSIEGLSQAQKGALHNANVHTVEVNIKTQSERMTRLTTGSALDTFRVENVTISTMTPVNLGAEIIEIAAWNDSSSSDQLMRKSATGGIEFEQADIRGLWGVEIYNSTNFNNNHFEIVDFSTDGTGATQDTGTSFNWSISNGTLNLVFTDFMQSYSIIDSNNGDLSIYSEAKDNEGKLLASLFGYATQIESTTQFTTDNSVTGIEKYWQTTINQWTANSWDGDNLEYCNSGNCDNGNVFFGFQTKNDNTGIRYMNAEGSPPALTDYSGDEMSWSLKDTGKLKHTYVNRQCEDKDESCSYREWRLLKVVDGRLGQRIYVQEADLRRRNSTDDWGYYIAPRWNMYELIDLEYFNNVNTPQATPSSGKTKSASSVNHVAKGDRIILEPTKSLKQRH